MLNVLGMDIQGLCNSRFYRAQADELDHKGAVVLRQACQPKMLLRSIRFSCNNTCFRRVMATIILYARC